MKKRTLLAIFGFLAAAMVISFTVGEQILQGIRPTLWSFTIVHFLGYLWFLLMPVEALILVMVAAGHNPLIIFLISIATAIPATMIDYAFGLLVPQHVIEDMVGAHRSGKYHRLLEKWGKYVVLFFAATPLSSPILTLVGGMARFPFRQMMAYTFAGFAFKYAIIVVLASFL